MPVSPASEPNSIFSVTNVVKAYGKRRAVDDVSLDFIAGRTTALIGSSGSGKSSLLRLLVGLEWPDAGQVRFEGVLLERNRLLQLRQRIGYVIQEGGLFPHLSVIGNLGLLARHIGWDHAHIYQRATELAELTHLSIDLLERFPAELSGGQRQRVALMRALMLNPDALLLDEPLGARDPIVRYELQDDLRDIFQRLGKSVVLVTHDLSEAAFFAERLVLLHNGRVLQDGSLGDFRRHPADTFVEQFVQARRELPDARS